MDRPTIKICNDSIKELEKRITERFDSQLEPALYDAFIYGEGTVKIYPDKREGIKVTYIPKFKPKKWWQWWG